MILGMAKDCLGSRSASYLWKCDSLELMVFRACNRLKIAKLMEFSYPVGPQEGWHSQASPCTILELLAATSDQPSPRK